MTQADRAANFRKAIKTCIEPDEKALAKLGDLFTTDVVVWSPNLFVGSLDELTETLAFREQAFSDVDIRIDALDVFANKGFAELRMSATFSGPFVIDNDVMIEPNGQELVLGAAAVADFEGDKIKALRAYFDDASLLEQMLTG